MWYAERIYLQDPKKKKGMLFQGYVVSRVCCFKDNMLFQAFILFFIFTSVQSQCLIANVMTNSLLYSNSTCDADWRGLQCATSLKSMHANYSFTNELGIDTIINNTILTNSIFFDTNINFVVNGVIGVSTTNFKNKLNVGFAPSLITFFNAVLQYENITLLAIHGEYYSKVSKLGGYAPAKAPFPSKSLQLSTYLNESSPSKSI